MAMSLFNALERNYDGYKGIAVRSVRIYFTHIPKLFVLRSKKTWKNFCSDLEKYGKMHNSTFPMELNIIDWIKRTLL